MQLKTPKRYRPNQRNRRVVGSWRGLRNLILVGLVAYVTYWAYQNQEIVWDRLLDARQEAETGIQSAQTAIPRAPTATPNVSDDLVEANTAYTQGDYRRAAERYTEVVKGQPNNLEVHYRLAFSLIITSNLGLKTDQIAQAVEVGTQAINAAPESPDGWSIRAMALVWARNYGEAIAYAQRALEIDPNFVQAKAILAEAYWRVGRQEQAIITIDEAVEYLRGLGAASIETTATVFRVKGFIEEQRLNRDEAIAAYEQARRAAPMQTYIAYELSLSYLGNGQQTEAIALLRSTLETSPRDTTLLLQLGRLYINIGSNDEALQAFQSCIDADPTAANCYAWLGGMQFYASNYAPAITNLEKAIENGTDDIDVYWQLGRSHAQLLRCDTAISIYRTGYQMALETENTSVQERIERYLADCGAVVEAPQQPQTQTAP